MLFVSHKLNEVFEIAERVTVLRDGRSMGTRPASELADDKLTELMTGPTVTHEYLDHEPNWDKVLLSVRNRTKARNFKDISFDLHEREILGITGLIGSGRTELAQARGGRRALDQRGFHTGSKRRRCGANAVRNSMRFNSGRCRPSAGGALRISRRMLSLRSFGPETESLTPGPEPVYPFDA